MCAGRSNRSFNRRRIVAAIRNVLWWLVVAALLWLSDRDRLRGDDAVEAIGVRAPGAGSRSRG
jgi:hypothetical protein